MVVEEQVCNVRGYTSPSASYNLRLIRCIMPTQNRTDICIYRWIIFISELLHQIKFVRQIEIQAQFENEASDIDLHELD